MNLTEFLARLQQHPAFQDCLDRLRAASAASVTISVADVARSYLLAALHAGLNRPLLLITARPAEARTLRDEIACWHPSPANVLLFPEQDALPYETLPPDPQITAERLAVLSRLSGLQRDGSPESAAPLVVVCARAASDLLAAPASFARAVLRLKVGDHVRPDDLIRRWLDLGYEPAPVVDTPGQLARRGGILDIYPMVGDACRVEFFGDEVDSLRAFDPLTQRSLTQIDALLVTPSAERSPGGEASLVSYLAPDGLIVLDQPDQIGAVAGDFERQVEGLRDDLIARADLPPDTSPPYLLWAQLEQRIAERPGARVILEHDPDAELVPFAHPPAFGGRLGPFVAECQRLLSSGRQVIVVTQQSQRLNELLEDDDLATRSDPEPAIPPTRVGANGFGGSSPRPVVISGQLQEGWQSPALGLTVFTDHEIFGWHKIRRPTRPRRASGRQTFLSELSPGDLVVHVDHGIAWFRGMVTMESEPRSFAGTARSDGQENSSGASAREYLLLEYAQGDRLYVPADQADRVARYIGAGDSAPIPTRLGSGDWTRAKRRVRTAVREIAQDLLQLYAARRQAEGFAFPADTPWQAEVEASFPYVETPDQFRALDDVKRDMEDPKPMDRLLVGDVGFGKTEIAIRAAFKAVEAGKQVAVLVPTTVLAQQHWNTFRERLAAFPVRIEMLSRFRSAREQRALVRGLVDGSVDICIGTHRLLQKDVRFKDLGLVIVDEEQRFGVVHKERLKELRREVDVLTLTATPIPRTMHMSLVGVRDMSTIETPPEERQPIRTYVTQYDEGLVREAILRELDRGGQVYYVHNRVQSIEIEARRLRELVPEARIAIAHGQMPEEQLERVMLEFADGKHDLLVCTTIIESGLDIPNVNTLIVNRAHHFGLSQLYQLRGRVGRSAARAYAYFLFTSDTSLSETAEQRLRTIFEATELGAGFRIALKDLEIRGAGNLLGAEQHGHVNAVGFDLYTRLLAEAVSQLKVLHEGVGDGKPATVVAPSTRPGPSVSLPVSAYLPADYVEDEATRLNLYQRLAAVIRGEELGELVTELIDRFGPLPAPAQNLAYVISLRLTAERAGVQRIQSVDGEVVVTFERLPRVDVPGLARTVGTPLRAGSNQLRFQRGSGQGWMVQLQTLVESLPPAAA